MGQTRREFMKDMAAVSAVAASGSIIAESAAETREEDRPDMSERCPYFDQPMYCRELNKTGKPLCEE